MGHGSLVMGHIFSGIGRSLTFLCHCTFRLAFFATFSVLTIPVWFLALVLDFPPIVPKSAEGLRCRGRFLARCAWVMWSLALRLCFWLRVDTKGVEPFYQGAGLGSRPVFICVNHVSMLDTPLVCVLMPWRLVQDMKVLMARAYLGLPVLGRLANGIGHLPLPFISRTNGDFRMDPAKLAGAVQRIDDHVASGGHFIVFPEGQLNREWHNLRQFRGGSFEYSIRHDMEVWGLVIVGAADSWPEGSPLGGSPAKLVCRAVKIADSARETAAKLAGPDASIAGQGQALANMAQAEMQRELSEGLARRSGLDSCPSTSMNSAAMRDASPEASMNGKWRQTSSEDRVLLERNTM